MLENFSPCWKIFAIYCLLKGSALDQTVQSVTSETTLSELGRDDLPVQMFI